MTAICVFSALLAAAVAMAAPALESRQYTGMGDLCDLMGLDTIPFGSLEVWDMSASTMYGYLSPAVDNTIGGGYGVLTSDINQALWGGYLCGGPSTSLNAYVMGFLNAQVVPGTGIGAVGVIMPSTPNGGSSTMNPSLMNWAALGPAYITYDNATPDPTDIGFIPGGDTFFESSAWKTSNSGGHHWFTPSWVNPAGDRVSLQLAALPEQGAIVATGSFSKFAQEYSYVGNWVQVQLASTGNPYA